MWALPILSDAVWVVQCASNLLAFHGARLCWLALDYMYLYLDDIIIFSKSIEQHIVQLGDVFARIKGVGLNISPSK